MVEQKYQNNLQVLQLLQDYKHELTTYWHTNAALSQLQEYSKMAQNWLDCQPQIWNHLIQAERSKIQMAKAQTEQLSSIRQDQEPKPKILEEPKKEEEEKLQMTLTRLGQKEKDMLTLFIQQNKKTDAQLSQRFGLPLQDVQQYREEIQTDRSILSKEDKQYIANNKHLAVSQTCSFLKKSPETVEAYLKELKKPINYPIPDSEEFKDDRANSIPRYLLKVPQTSIEFDEQGQQVKQGPIKDKDLQSGDCVCKQKCGHVINLLVVGITGSGKSTFLDCVANYLYGVEFYDNFRYKLVEERNIGSASETSKVTIYHIGSDQIKRSPGGVKFCLNIIDTPGLADTRGQRWDHKIQMMIRTLLQSVTALDYVCLTIKYTDFRDEANTRFIYQVIRSFFACNVASRFLGIFTHCLDDKDMIAAQEVAKKTGIEFYQKFRFENRAIMQFEDSYDFERFFDGSYQNMELLFSKIVGLCQPVNTGETIINLELREKVSKAIEEATPLCEQMERHMVQIANEIRSTQELKAELQKSFYVFLQELKDEIARIDTSNILVQQVTYEKVATDEPNFLCDNCGPHKGMVCHRCCDCPEGTFGYCKMINRQGYCEAVQEAEEVKENLECKCPWVKHSKQHYRYEKQIKKVEEPNRIKIREKQDKVEEFDRKIESLLDKVNLVWEAVRKLESVKEQIQTHEKSIHQISGRSPIYIDTDYYEVQLRVSDISDEEKSEIECKIKQQKLLKNIVSKQAFGVSEDNLTTKQLLQQKWDAPALIEKLQNMEEVTQIEQQIQEEAQAVGWQFSPLDRMDSFRERQAALRLSHELSQEEQKNDLDGEERAILQGLEAESLDEQLARQLSMEELDENENEQAALNYQMEEILESDLTKDLGAS